MDKGDLTALMPHMTEAGWWSGQRLHDLGAPVGLVHFPSTASLAILTLMADGAEVECATVGNESAVGLLAALTGQAPTSRTHVQLAGSGISVDGPALRRQADKSPALLGLLLGAAQTLVAQDEQSVACKALHGVRSRLARWLLTCQDRIQATTMPITQESLAIMLGVQRPTVGAAAAELRDDGMIRYSRGNLQILDRAGLRLQACECYDATRQVRERLLPTCNMDEAHV